MIEKPPPVITEASNTRELTNREPIFLNVPLGTAILVVALVASHLSALVLPQATVLDLLNRFAVFPAKFDARLVGGRLGIAEALQALIGHAFFHSGWMHLAFNVAMLMQVGGLAEAGLRRSDRGGSDIGGAFRLIIYFLLCGIGGGLAFVALAQPQSFAIGASGAISGVFAGYLWFSVLTTRGNPGWHRPILIQAGVFLLLNVGGAAMLAVIGAAPIAWQAHLGGFLAGGLLFPLIMRR